MKGFIEGIKKILGNEGGFWIPLAVGALGGLAKGIADKKATKRHNLAQAEL